MAGNRSIWPDFKHFISELLEIYLRIIHPLQMPYFSVNNKSILHDLAKNTCKKTRNHVIVGKKSSEIF